jgi:hypothetical protein
MQYVGSQVQSRFGRNNTPCVLANTTLSQLHTAKRYCIFNGCGSVRSVHPWAKQAACIISVLPKSQPVVAMYFFYRLWPRQEISQPVSQNL